MARDPSHIFLSGASGDFAQVRLDLNAALVRGLCRVTHQDSFPQTAADTLQKLAQLIEPCGVVVHMIGTNPGAIPKSQIREAFLKIVDCDGRFLVNRHELRQALGDLSTLTYTQWEAYMALHFGIPLLVYADPTFSSSDHPQRAHLDRLKDVIRHASPFQNESELERLVMADLMAHFRLHPSTAAIPQAIKPSNLPWGYIGQTFLGRDEFLDQIRESLLKRNPAVPPQLIAATSISGLGGSGKTHAAIEYGIKYQSQYSALLFVSTDTPDVLYSTLAGLCEVLNIDQPLSSRPPDEAGRLKAVINWLATHQNWLLICDNCDSEISAQAIVKTLGNLAGGHLLLTSRLQNWPNQIEMLLLETLDEEAASELLLNLTSKRRRPSPAPGEEAIELAKLLGCLPLALHQAAGYMNEQRLDFISYIDLYNKEAATLLAWFNKLSIPYQTLEELGPQPVITTWKTSFSRLPPVAQAWLVAFSFYSSESIPEFVFETSDGHPDGIAATQAAFQAVVQAENYSLLKRDQNYRSFKIHRLVQLVLRITASKEEATEALYLGISILLDCAPLSTSHLWTSAQWDLVSPHLKALCAHSERGPFFHNSSLLFSKLGTYYSDQGMYNLAEDAYERALHVDISFGDPQDISRSSSNLATVLEQTGRAAEAEILMREVVRLDEEIDSPHIREQAVHLDNLALLLGGTHRGEEAEQLHRRALAMLESEPLLYERDIATTLNNLGLLLKEDPDRLEEAEHVFRRALRLTESSFGVDHPKVALSMSNLAVSLRKRNKYEEAENLYRKSAQILESSYPQGLLDLGLVYTNLASLLARVNRIEESKSFGFKAVQAYRHVCDLSGHQHANFPMVVLWYLELLRSSGASESNVIDWLDEFLFGPPSWP